MSQPAADPRDQRLIDRAHPAVVEATQALSPRLHRIRVHSPAIAGMDLPVAGKFKLRVAPGAWRSYTPGWRDEAAGRFELIACAHGSGPGSTWATTCQPGDALHMLGPKESFALDHDADWAVALGDETTLGLWEAVAAAHGRPLLGAVECAPEDHAAVAALDLGLEPVARRLDRGDALTRWVERDWPAGRGVFYLSGHHRSTVAVAARLQECGIPSAWIRRKAYWGEGRKQRRKAS